MLICVLILAAVSFREPAVIPPVEKMTCRTDVEVRLDAAQTLTVRCGDKAAADWADRHVRQWFGVTPKVIADQASVDGPEEGYRLTAKPSGIVVEAKTLRGVRHALYSLRQIAERDSSGATVTYYRMPEFEIGDSPAMTFRGIHFCWLPELSASFIEREIRTAAFYKFNYVVLEPWGVFRSERHPWFGWKDGPMTKDVIRHLVDIAGELGVTLIPQINVFGHASASRSCTGKHASLDVSPERQSLFEPGGGDSAAMSSSWNWCLSNPAAVRTVKDLVVELHETFGNPPYFHIGCDEADEPTCASCRAEPYAPLVCRHITEIAELLKSRGARAMMWHDMLIRRGDVRWKGFYANGSEETAKLPQMLPKNVVICDWFYGEAKANYPTLGYFSTVCGFDTLTSPWNDPSGIRAQAKFAAEKGLLGILATTWHHFSGERYPKMVQTSACGAWGRGERLSKGQFATVWRQCGWDMGETSYQESGWFEKQVTRDILSK